MTSQIVRVAVSLSIFLLTINHIYSLPTTIEIQDKPPQSVLEETKGPANDLKYELLQQEPNSTTGTAPLYVVDYQGLTTLGPELSREITEGFRDVGRLLRNLSFGPSRVRRAAPRAPRPTCTVSRSVLQSLTGEITGALNKVSSDSAPSIINCQLNDVEASTDCAGLLKYIQCGARHLEVGYLDAVTNNASLQEYEALQNAYNKLAQETQRDVDEIKRSLEADKKREVDALQQTIQRLGTSLTKALRELREKTVKLCISEIASGKVAEAVEHFKSLKNDTELSQIIRDSFANYGKLENVEEILAFIRKLPSCAQDKLALPVLFQLMRNEDGGRDSPKMILLARGLDTCMKDTDLMRTVTSVVNRVVESWGGKVRGNNFQQIQDFAKDHLTEFRTVLVELIKSSYNGEITNADAVLDFINGLPYKRDDVIAYPVLYEEMKRTNSFDGHEMVTLAYRADKRDDDPGSDATTEEKEKLKGIRSSLPKGIKALLWDSFIFVKSRSKSTYMGLGRILYRNGVTEDQKGHDLVACSSSQDHFHKKWEVDVLENGRFFKLRETTSPSSHDRENSIRSTGSGDVTDVTGSRDEHQWLIIPEFDGQYFFIKNRGNGKILEVKEASGGWHPVNNEEQHDCSRVFGANGGLDWRNERQHWEII